MTTITTILCFGDSLTWGYNPLTHQRYPYEQRWTTLLENKLNTNGTATISTATKQYHVINNGLCGRTTIFDDPFLKNRNSQISLPTALETDNPDLVILMLGTNDCKTYINGHSDQVTLGCLHLIHLIHSHDSAIKIIVLVPPHIDVTYFNSLMSLFFNEEAENCSRELGERYKTLSKPFNVIVIDTNDYVHVSYDDGVHLNRIENDKLATKLFEYISEHPQ